MPLHLLQSAISNNVHCYIAFLFIILWNYSLKPKARRFLGGKIKAAVKWLVKVTKQNRYQRRETATPQRWLPLLLLSLLVVGKNSNEQGKKGIQNQSQMHMFACQRAAECFCSVWNTSKGYQLCMFPDSSFCWVQPAWGQQKCSL